MRERPVIAVANRLPVQQGDDGWELSPGGLVTALRPVMATHAGAWVGWDGGTKGMPPTLPESGGRLLPVGLSAAQVRNYYHGFANATLWPLLHNAIEKPRFERGWWSAYQDVNARFAESAVGALADAGHLRPDAVAGAGPDWPAGRGPSRLPHRVLPGQLPALVCAPAPGCG